MKKKLICTILAIAMVFSSFGVTGYARYESAGNTYAYRTTTGLEADIDDDKVVLTWPAVDTDGNLINANPLKAEGQAKSTGNPTAGWTTPTQGMIIAYDGWLPDGTHNTVSNDSKTTHDVIFGLTDKETEYPVAVLDPTDSTFIKRAYIDTTVVSSSLATAYQIQYSKDGINWTEDHITSTFNHGKKLSRFNEDGTYRNDNKNTFFLEDQLTEALQTTLEADTQYYIRVNAYDATAPATKASPYKTFETAIVTASAKVLSPAFPSAEGSGRYSQGGRGSAEQQADIYVVTNLTDSVSDPQPGSLRYGLERRDRADGNKAYPRIITFAVGGTINVDPAAVKSERRFNIGDNTTILGQTAPGEGITIYGASVKFSGKDIIVRYIRVRLGEGYDQDAATASGENIVIDHCTFNWGVDECFTAKELINSSIQYNIIANSLSMVNKNGALNSDVEIISGESEAKHGMGSILNGYETTFTHNLYANNGTRNPRFEGQFSYKNVTYSNKLEFSNNVIYNWGHNTGYGGERGSGEVNFTNNYHKAGPNTIEKVKDILFDVDGTTSKYYIEGNVLEGNDAVTSNNISGFKDIRESKQILSSPVELINPYEAESAEAAYQNVLNSVGASKTRDAQDSRLIYNIKNGTGNFINSEFEDGGTNSNVYASEETDSDNDGIPDAWEDAHGLNKNDPSDSTAIITDEASGNAGYTNIEVYAESLCTASQGPTVTGLTIKDADGNTLASSGNAPYAVLISGKSYVAAPSYEGSDLSCSIYLNDEKISDSAAITAGKTGRYNLCAKVTDSNGLSSLSPIIVVTIIDPAASDNLEGFASVDVGNVKAAGTDNYNPAEGTFIQQGAGHIGILATSSNENPDSFHYSYKKMSGDLTFVARIDNMAKLDYYQQSGIMIRSSLDPLSEFYMASLTYLKGENYEGIKDIGGNDVKAKNIYPISRTSYGNYTESPDSKFLGVAQTRAGEEPNHGWAKITKAGQQVTLSASLDGQTWYDMASYTTTLPESFYVGFATSAAQESFDFVRYNTTEFSNISLDGAEAPQLPDADLLGDVNCDSMITAADASLLLQYVLNNNTEVSPQGLANAMVTKTGAINSQNVAEILQKALDSKYNMEAEK